ncbi:octopamine receptor beta-2R-like, partial [Parasteatoda tepidariorum]|uniref:octopamine receptor beta-2R-like n=1 Tax=Parasteatoda tepidariorum TaxID=114398 RepID=UPI0039BD8C62
MPTMMSIILSAIFLNTLVIMSVYQNKKLQTFTNYFIVSLACTDILVALFAMTFNAIQTVMGRWIFGEVVCDFWNICDVCFSTASILHLCFISMDRYYSLVDPLKHRSKMTCHKVFVMLGVIWTLSAVISFIPIYMKIYTTDEHLKNRLRHPETCDFKVNKTYAIISSGISFWVPGTLIVGAYIRIYRLAKQATDTSDIDAAEHNDKSISPREKGDPTVIKRNFNKLKKGHKPEKTLGLISGAFIICWLPFFVWYDFVSLCSSCECPEVIGQILFWAGYCNSSLNPIIYAYFNHEFRTTFK